MLPTALWGIERQKVEMQEIQMEIGRIASERSSA
jgi:hypothetical protein